MVIVDCEQGSPEWLAVRLGIPTASRFDELITQAFGYMCECVAETALGKSLDASKWMERGTEMEAARAWYAMAHDCDVREVGFVLRDDRRTGCSPDGLLGDDGGLEIKIPGAGKHAEYMLHPSKLVAGYFCQVQGSLWITERKWWDLMSYNPAMSPVVRRVERDEEFIKALAECVDDFLGNLDDAKAAPAAYWTSLI